MVSFANLSRAQKGGVRYSRRPMTNALVNGLKGEIHASADHSEIIVGAVHKIPTEITDPADVRR